MIYELRISRQEGTPKQQTVKFTHFTCNGKPIQHAERLMSGFDRFQLLERHFEGREATRDYGYGRGYEPIIVGSV